MTILLCSAAERCSRRAISHAHSFWPISHSLQHRNITNRTRMTKKTSLIPSLTITTRRMLNHVTLVLDVIRKVKGEELAEKENGGPWNMGNIVSVLEASLEILDYFCA
ncbi:hypothetical protein HNY73_007905 [Argiope bruennichi]|uniref:Uncharacterized protein n=1 Tax=Argiope bruennichi TaxID=94029 RepID=A0A8T0F746_ARGBR|nr:hypothetical protein HNY73_007905 [Argiope bruennichi]